MALTHYIIVRRDLPLGVVCAQVAHAAGESFAAYQRTVGPWFHLPHTIAVVLGTGTERRLKNLEKRLVKVGVPHVAIREPDAPWNGALMAIGLWPADRERVAKLMKDFNPISELSCADVADRTLRPASNGVLGGSIPSISTNFAYETP